MKTVSPAELPRDLRRLWSEVDDDSVVVVQAGRPVALVTNMSGRTLQEIEREHVAFQAYQAVCRLQAHSRRRGLSRMSSAEIDREIRQARRTRRRKPA